MVRLEQLPSETILEVLKYLDYYELCKCQPSTTRLNAVIDRYRHELALCKFYQIEIFPTTHVFLADYRKAIDLSGDFEASFGENKNVDDIYHINLDDEQREKWELALRDYIPLYSYPEPPDRESLVEDFVIYISKNEDSRAQGKRLRLELPYYPANMSDMFFTRFWLDQLARVQFKYIDCGKTLFNTGMLECLFANDPIPSGKLHLNASRIWFNIGGFDQEHNQRTIQFMQNHLNADSIVMRTRSYFEAILDFLLDGGAHIRKVIFPHGPAYSTVDLQNLLIIHARNSHNSSKMVPCIEFNGVNDLPWPDLSKAVKIEKGTDDHMDFTKFKLTNPHNNMEFLIEIGHLSEDEFKRFTIQRVNN